MRRLAYALFLVALQVGSGLAQAPAATRSPEDQVLDQEIALANAIRKHDAAASEGLLSPGYFYTVGQGQRLRIASKTVWLDLLRTYDVASFTLDDARVRVYGVTGVVTMLATEKAKVSAVDRTIQYFITDIWLNEQGAWRLAERHSSRPDPTVMRTQTEH